MSKLVTIESCAKKLAESPDGEDAASLIAEIKRMAATLPPQMTALANLLTGDDITDVANQIASLAIEWQGIYQPQMDQLLASLRQESEGKGND